MHPILQPNHPKPIPFTLVPTRLPATQPYPNKMPPKAKGKKGKKGDDDDSWYVLVF
jgi:hypothetical protein